MKREVKIVEIRVARGEGGEEGTEDVRSDIIVLIVAFITLVVAEVDTLT